MRKRLPGPNWPPLALSQIEQCTHKHATASDNQKQQVRTDSRQWTKGRGRAGQGMVQWLVVVVVAASETVRLSWIALLTVDSLSSVDLTSQGFFYIPACARTHGCVGACEHGCTMCVYVCISRLGDVTRSKQICPLRKTKAFLLAF